MLKKKKLFMLCLTLTVALGVGVVQADYVAHTGSVDPTTEGWTLSGGSNVGAGTEMGKDYWYIEDISTANTGSYAYTLTTAQTNTSWRITEVLRVASAAADNSGVVMVLFDTTTLLNSRLDEGKWQYQNSSNEWTNVTTLDTKTAYHRYDIVCEFTNPGEKSWNDAFKFYVDTVEVLSITRLGIRTHSAGPSLTWGDSSSFATAESHWNSVVFSDDLTIPEPATMFLLTSSGVLLLVRRRL